MRFCINLFVLVVCTVACSSNSTKKTGQPASTGTDTSTNTATNTGTDAGQSDAGTENCAPWPREKLMPAIGPFFFGANPRPCRVKYVSSDTNLYYEYSDGHLIAATAVASNDKTTYQLEGDLIVGATRTQPSGTSTIAFEYTDDLLIQTTTAGGTQSSITYQLGPNGYPTLATLQPPQQGQPVRFVHEYDTCRLVRRVAYNADGSVSNDNTAEYHYDALGRIEQRYTPKDDQLYGYLDESDSCIMP